MLAFAGGVLSLCMCVLCVLCVCTGEEDFEMKACRDGHEDRQRQQVVLRALLLRVKEGKRFLCQQINNCGTGRGLSISDRLTQTKIKG